MQRTYKPKKGTRGGVDPRDMLFTLDEKSSAFDAFYIQNIKQTKRELSCMVTSTQHTNAVNKVRKRKYVRRIVKDVEPPICESTSRSTYLTPDKSLRVNRGEDLFDQLLYSSSQQEQPALKSSNNLFDKLRLSIEKKKTYAHKKKKKATIKKLNCSSSESSDSGKENNVTPVQNMTNILKHELLIEGETKNSPEYHNESINHMVNNLSLFTRMIKKNTQEESPRRSPRLDRNRLTKNLISVDGSPQCSTPFTEKYRSKSIYNFSPIPMGDLNESKEECIRIKPNKTEDFQSDDLNQVPGCSDDVVHSPILKCVSKSNLSNNSSNRSNNSQTKKISKDNVKESSIPERESSIPERESSTDTVMQKEKSSEVSMYEDSAENTPFLGFTINALKGTSIYKVLDSSKNNGSSLQTKKSLFLHINSLNEPKDRGLKSKSLEKVTEEHYELSNIDQANVITHNETQMSVEVEAFIGFSDTTAKNTEDVLKYYERINKCNDNSVTEITMVEASDAQHDNKAVRNSFDSASSEKFSNTLHSVSKRVEETGNESVDSNDNNDDKESFYETCSRSDDIRDASLNNSDSSERKEPVIVIDKLNDSTFKKYYEKVVEIYSSSSNNNSSHDENQDSEADKKLEKETVFEDESYMEESNDGSIDFKENDTIVDSVIETCNISSSSDESEANETLYKLESSKDAIPCEENTTVVYDSSDDYETFSSIDKSRRNEADKSVEKEPTLEDESYIEESHEDSIEFEENDTMVDTVNDTCHSNITSSSDESEASETLYELASGKDNIPCEEDKTIVNDNSDENDSFSSLDNPSDDSCHSDVNETLYRETSQNDSIEVHATMVEDNEQNKKTNCINYRRCDESPNESLYREDESIIDEENTTVLDHNDKNTVNISITQADSEEVTESQSNDEDEKINFVTTRRRNEITNYSLLCCCLDDSYDGASSSNCDKTVMSNKCKKEDLDNSKVEEVVSRKVSLPELTEIDRQSITMRRSSKITLNNTRLEESNLDCSTVKPAIVLQPGKKWERSLSIYRRMTVLSNFNSSILDDEDCRRKGRNYRLSVLNTMELQEHSGPLHNDSFSSFRSSIAPKPHRSTIRIVKEPSSSSSRVSLCATTVFDDLTGFLAEECDDTLAELSKLSIADLDHDVTVVEKLHDTSGRHTTARDYVLRRCDQIAPILFDECYPETILKNCRKIGEGVYGEVYLWRARDGPRVMKVVPVAGLCKVNGEQQKDYHEIIAEIVIAMELSALRAPIAAIERHFDEGLDADSLDLHSTENATDAFNEVKAVRCLYGNYPSRLLDLWELYDETTGSENDNPAILPPDQQYIVLELANAGQDLESYTFNSAEQAYALFLQVAFALAVGEESLQFEHRDLHWGNVLIAPTEQKYATFVINGRVHRVPRRGVAATIIDYSLSRVSLPLGGGGGGGGAESAALYNELSSDEALFEAVGDYQFEVYRLMREKLQNDWKTFEPYTNVLWLHYIADKMITALRYRRTNTKLHKLHIAKLRGLRARILEHTSAKHLLTELLHNEL